LGRSTPGTGFRPYFDAVTAELRSLAAVRQQGDVSWILQAASFFLLYAPYMYDGNTEKEKNGSVVFI
jgi:hypothetical protein